MTQITLRVLDGADRGRIYSSLSTPVTIGREEGNSVQLNDERVSRFHLKIQEDEEKIVLTDLESTNGTKVNGEDIQLRILRHGDIIHVGRSVILYGSREEIAERLAALRNTDGGKPGTMPGLAPSDPPSLDFELSWSEQPDDNAMFRPLEPPELPSRLKPGQAAQLSELLEYLHVRLRELLSSARPDKAQDGRLTLDDRSWQGVLDMQAQLAGYLRDIGNPPEDQGSDVKLDD